MNRSRRNFTLEISRTDLIVTLLAILFFTIIVCVNIIGLRSNASAAESIIHSREAAEIHAVETFTSHTSAPVHE